VTEGKEEEGRGKGVGKGKGEKGEEFSYERGGRKRRGRCEKWEMKKEEEGEV